HQIGADPHQQRPLEHEGKHVVSDDSQRNEEHGAPVAQSAQIAAILPAAQRSDQLDQIKDMDIAKAKRRENIAEYILYLWQLEDLLRALQFSPEAVFSQ